MTIGLFYCDMSQALGSVSCPAVVPGQSLLFHPFVTLSNT